jgi:hypothetical protein
MEARYGKCEATTYQSSIYQEVNFRVKTKVDFTLLPTLVIGGMLVR